MKEPWNGRVIDGCKSDLVEDSDSQWEAGLRRVVKGGPWTSSSERESFRRRRDENALIVQSGDTSMNECRAFDWGECLRFKFSITFGVSRKRN